MRNGANTGMVSQQQSAKFNTNCKNGIVYGKMS